ncbi:MAG: MerR family transcriptional regulator [Spirochaetales bacterium]|nr:MerR family transcriptional regulator [Spirochaetales bacterium]
MLSIGEFSQVTRMTIKTLRYYHELGILVPIRVDQTTGYRYYDDKSYNQATAVIALKDMGFALLEIKTILDECESEDDLHRFIIQKLKDIRSKAAELKELEDRLSAFERQIDTEPPDLSDEIQEITLTIPHLLAAPIRGRYDELSAGFKLLYKKGGRYGVGKPYGFYYDLEYQEEDARMEAAMEINRKMHIDGLKYRRIENLSCVKTIYRGQYGNQGGTYLKLFNYCHEKGYTPTPPIIEHFIKGPGIIFTGNPKNYVTECIVLIDKSQATHFFPR